MKTNTRILKDNSVARENNKQSGNVYIYNPSDSIKIVAVIAAQRNRDNLNNTQLVYNDIQLVDAVMAIAQKITGDSVLKIHFTSEFIEIVDKFFKYRDSIQKCV